MTQDVPANHPMAPRMCTIAFLAYNVTIAAMWGTFQVLLAEQEKKLGITRDLSALSVSIVFLGQSLASPFVGILAEKFSLRMLMVAGTVMHVLAYIVLGLSNHIVINYAAYGLLIGPGLCLTASVLPGTLVTRWYQANRGRALGLMSMPIVQAVVPPATAIALGAYGLSVSYGLIAATVALLIVPMLLIVDYPPNAPDHSGTENAAKPAEAGIAVARLLRSPKFWILSLAFAALTANAAFRGAHLILMVRDWEIDLTMASTLLSAGSLAGMAGSVFFGWLGDRLGGAGALGLLCLNSGILWAIMLLEPSYVALLFVVGLMGLHGAAMVAAYGLALSQQFGNTNYSRAFGIGFTISLPFNFLVPPLAGRAYMATDSYAGAIIGVVALLAITGVLVIGVRAPKVAPAAA